MLFWFINEMFNFGIKNVVGKPIIDKSWFYIFEFIKEDNLRGGNCSLTLEISVFIIVL